jgi:hypothetical protein
MGAFILGLIVGAAGALLLFIYDEGEIFLKLSRQIKTAAGRYKQAQGPADPLSSAILCRRFFSANGASCAADGLAPRGWRRCFCSRPRS